MSAQFTFMLCDIRSGENEVGVLNGMLMSEQRSEMSLRGCCITAAAPALSTPWSRVLVEKLTGFAASQEIPRIFGTRRFITVLTSARHLSLS